ncbi:MAG TPA: hypothetical protein VEY50_12330 [Lysobacter sp.]|nr:hypothetical protein [Lysobacter sp.]
MHTAVPLAILLGLLASLPAPARSPAPSSTPAARAAIDASTSSILQGDARAALDALDVVPASEFAGVDLDYRRCLFGRFDRSAPPVLSGHVTDPLARDVLHAYQAYWWYALNAPATRAHWEAWLLQRLKAQLGPRAADAGSLDALEPVLIAALRDRGYHALLGVTPPLRELMLWREQETRTFDVVLPEGVQRVEVDLLDGFAARGWSAYGRCERGSNGGWATAEKLFAVRSVYPGGLDGEAFRVVFLAHEAQHLADKRRYPGIASWELEFRAKLTELALAETVSEKRLRYITTAQSENPESPHTYANKRVVAALTARLGRAPEQVSRAELQQAARSELAADTARRTAP